MKYSDKHPQVVEKYKARVAQFQLPYEPEFLAAMEPEEMIVYSGLAYPCSNCRTVTAWIDESWGIPVHTCSEECKDQMWRDYEKSVALLDFDSLSAEQNPSTEPAHVERVEAVSPAPGREQPPGHPERNDLA